MLPTQQIAGAITSNRIDDVTKARKSVLPAIRSATHRSFQIDGNQDMVLRVRICKLVNHLDWDYMSMPLCPI